MLPEHFRYSITVTPRFSDVDKMGHVNNARYLTYMEEARIKYAYDVLNVHFDEPKTFMIVAKTTIDYLMPLAEGQTVIVYARCSRLGRKSFDLNYLLVAEDDQDMVAMATTTMVAYDYKTQGSVLIPNEWRETILAYEKLPPEKS